MASDTNGALNPEDIPETKSSQSKAFEVFATVKFWCYAVACVSTMGCNLSFYFFVPKMCESLLNVSREQSGLLVALMGISSTLTRPLVGLLADCEKFNPLIIYSVGCIGWSLLLLFISFLSSTNGIVKGFYQPRSGRV